MKRVLIITYYWPPMGGGGVQRWLKFTRYLRKYGWEPVIYTPANADISNPDHNLLKEVPQGIEVIRRKIWEPFDLYKKASGKSSEEKIQPGFLQESSSNALVQKIAVWIRGNIFIPDAKKFWIRPSIQFLSEYLKKNPVDAVISTGPPHTNHLIALGLKKKLGLKWMADFRDPWTNIDYYDKLMLSKWADRRHHVLEKSVLSAADEVVTVSWSWARDFGKVMGRLPSVVTNGFDPEDFNNVVRLASATELSITHIGSLNKDRNPVTFWKVLGRMKKESVLVEGKFKVKLIGPTDLSVFNEIRKNELEKFVQHRQHIPHNEVLKEVVSSDALLLLLNDTPNIDGVIPGKLYEYLASRRPIICIGKPTGDSAKIILECNAGKIADFRDDTAMYQILSELIKSHNNGTLASNETIIDKYSRVKLAGDIASILDRITAR